VISLFQERKACIATFVLSRSTKPTSPPVSGIHPPRNQCQETFSSASSAVAHACMSHGTVEVTKERGQHQLSDPTGSHQHSIREEADVGNIFQAGMLKP